MTSPVRYETGADRVVTVTFDAPDARVNTMTDAWREAFRAALDRLEAERDGYDGVILTSAKKTFFAGAELRDLLKLQPSDGPATFEWIEGIKRDFRRLERLGRPVVAALTGTALGGGWEIALSCHGRICLDDDRIQLGLPEVTIGLLPAAGGVTKMTRLLGLQAAFPYLVEGRTLSPQAAGKLGLLHGLAANPQDLFSMAREWIRANPKPLQPWDDPRHRLPGGTPASPKVAQMLAIAPAMLLEKTRGLYPAPEAILAAMVEGAEVDFETAMRIESRYGAQVSTGQVAKNMITAFFFNLAAIRGGASRPKGVPPWRPAKVGILGAGMMGAGIAWACASRSIDCVLKDVSADKAAAGKARSEKLAAGRVESGRMSEPEARALLDRIVPADSADALQGCDLIIEAVFEQRALKAEVTREAEPKLAPGGIFASNTSTLPIGSLAQATADPARFVGLHFFSPVDKMRLVEIIKGAQTSAETLAKAYDAVLALGKTPIVVNDARGFYTSRTFGTYVMEGCAMLAEGIPAAVIENAARLAGMPVGPLAVIDETSLSLSVHVMEQTRADLEAAGQPYVPAPGEEVILRMVKEFKRAGRAAGAGFYDYPAESGKRLWPGLAGAFGAARAGYQLDELKDRFLYRQAVETARCIAEGVLESVHDANIGSIFGIGFPAWTGGALQFINSVGPGAFAERADALAARYGPRFTPPPVVRELAAQGKTFG